MSIKTSKRIALGVIAGLVFAPFAAIAPASATQATTAEVTAVSVAAPATGRVGSPLAVAVGFTTFGALAAAGVVDLAGVLVSRPAGSTATVIFDATGRAVVGSTGGTSTPSAAAGFQPAKLVVTGNTSAYTAGPHVAGRVGIIPDVAGTYVIKVWHDQNLNGAIDPLEARSADVTFTVGVAPTTITATAINVNFCAAGADGALVKLTLPAGTGLALGESIRISPSTASADIIEVNGVVVTHNPGAASFLDLVGSQFVDGVAYVNVTDSAVGVASLTLTMAGQGTAVAGATGTIALNGRTCTVAATTGTTVIQGAAGTEFTATTVGIQGSSATATIPLATRTVTYFTSITAGAAVGNYFGAKVTDTSGRVTGSKITATPLVFDVAYIGAANATTATTIQGSFSLTMTPSATGQSFGVVTLAGGGATVLTSSVTVDPVVTSDGKHTVSPSAAISLQTGASISYTTTLLDKFNRAIPNASVKMVITGRNANQTVTPPTTTTNALGQATFTLTDGPSAGTTSLTDSIVFTATGADTTAEAATAVTITWSATALAVGTVALATPTTLDVAPAITYSDINSGATGAQATVVTVSATVKDASGNLLAGVPVTFTTADTGAAVLTTTATGYTSAAGVATASVYGWTAGIKTFTATAGGIAGTGTVNFNQQTATEARTVSAALVGKLATVTVKDRFGNTIEGVNILGTRTGTGYFGTGSTSATGTTDKNGEASFVVEGVGTFKFSATTTLGVENLAFGQTSAIKGNAVGALATGVLTATVAGTAILAETGVGASFDAAGANSATVTTTAPVAPAVVVPPVVYDNPTLSFVKDGSRVILSGTAVDGEGDIIIYTKKVGTTAWKERAKTLEVAAPGDFNGSIKAPKSNVLIRVKQEGTGQFSNQIIVLK